MMALKGVGALPVIDDQGDLTGIISERDYARKIILKSRSSRETTVSEIMTQDLVTVHEDNTVSECMALMTQRKIRHLPVKRDGRLVGIVSVGDLVKSIIDEQSTAIDQLERYIKGEATGIGP
ncbi:MAG: CBS domain-containing protein [Candidatus Azotimanducaceae bacterium]|jgi:CBS domain-containing protein